MAMQAHQLLYKDKDLEKVMLNWQCIRFEGKKRHDEKYGIYNEEFAIGNIILLHDTRHNITYPANYFFNNKEYFKSMIQLRIYAYINLKNWMDFD